MAKTYRQKRDELLLESLRIIEQALKSDDPSYRFSNAALFLAYQPDSALNEAMPEESDALEAELIGEKQDEK